MSPIRALSRRLTLHLLRTHFAECDKSFTRSDALSKHMRVQHAQLYQALSASNAQRTNPTSLAARAAHVAMLAVFEGGREASPAAEKRWQDEEREWERLDRALGGKGSVPKRPEFVDEPTSTSAGPSGRKKSVKANKKSRPKRKNAAGESSSDLTSSEEEEAVLAGPSPSRSEDEGAGSDSDDSLSSFILPPPLSLTTTSAAEPAGEKPAIVQKYLLAKALHRVSLRRRAELEWELEQVESEFRRVREGKERALEELLTREFEYVRLCAPSPSRRPSLCPTLTACPHLAASRAEGAALVAKPTRADLPARLPRKSHVDRLSPTKASGAGRSGSDFDGNSGGDGEGDHDSDGEDDDEDDRDQDALVKEEMQVDLEISALS